MRHQFLLNVVLCLSLSSVALAQLGDVIEIQLASRDPRKCNLEMDPVKDTIVVLSSRHARHTGEHGFVAVQESYLNRKGFCSIGTNFVIDGAGKIFRGRPLEQKAACSTPNAQVIGITLMECFHHETGYCEDGLSGVTDELIASLQRVIASMAKQYGIAIDSEHVIEQSRRQSNNRDWIDCPGNLISDRWNDILEGAGALLHDAVQ